MALSLGLGAFLTGAYNLVSTYGQDVFNYITGKEADEEQRNYDREMTELSYQHDIDMWNRENAYNTPANQMQRLKDAGLNPLLMYQKGTTGNASTMPKYNKPLANRIQPLQLSSALGETMDVLNKYQDYKMKSLEINNFDSILEKRYNQINLLDVQSALQGKKAEILANTQEYQEEIQRQQLELIKKRIANEAKKAGISGKQLEWLEDKLHLMKFGVNIDRDKLIDRLIIKVLEDIKSKME